MPTKPKTTALELARRKLEESQITIAQAKALVMEVLDATETRMLGVTFNATPSIKINYVDPRTQALMRARPNWPAFFRARYLYPEGAQHPPGQDKLQRYAQEPGTGTCAYFPNVTDWPEIFKDPGRCIYITEGEFKAAKACLEGLPTIGLGGAWMFKSPQIGADFLPELEAVNWIKRRVVLVYDSDVRENPDVARALRALSELLMNRGALVHYGALPDILGPGKKVGLDDYFAHRTLDEFLRVVDATAPHITLGKVLFDYNERFCVIRSPGIVIDTELVDSNLTKYALDKFVKLESNKSYTETIVADNGNLVTRAVPAGGAWLSWPWRREYGRLVYAPGRPRYIQNCSPANTAYNTWRGWGVGEPFERVKEKPKNYNVKPFYNLFDHVFSAIDAEQKTWLLQWFAYPIQNPGQKMHTSLVLVGSVHGTGKSLLGEMIGKIYGVNYQLLEKRHLHSDFNGWAESCQFAYGDEITGSDKKEEADRLKILVTQRTVTINQKHVPTYVMDACTNFYFSSNRADAFMVDNTDRRYAIFETPRVKLTKEQYDAIGAWKNGDGALSLRWHFENEIDLKGFVPHAPAPMTGAKRRMMLSSQSDLTTWVTDLFEDPDSGLVDRGIRCVGDLYTTERLIHLFSNGQPTRVNARLMAAELNTAGFSRVCNDNLIATAEGKKRYWAIRNRDKWAKATTVQVREHIGDLEKNFNKPPNWGALSEKLRARIYELIEKEAPKG